MIRNSTEFNLRRLHLLHQQSVMALVATAINTTVYLLLAWNSLPHGMLLTWYGIFALLIAARVGEFRWWKAAEQSAPVTAEKICAAKLRFDALVFLSGVMWGLVGLMVEPKAPVQVQILGIFLLAGISAGAVVSYASSTRTILASILPMLVPLVLRMILSGDTVYQGMAPMLVLYILLIAKLGQNLAQHHDRSIAFTLEKASLLSERNVHKAASQAKSMFLARVSHEIRTPLSSIIGYADRALRTSMPGQRTDLEIIRRNGEHLLAMVNDLLDLARIESGQILFEKHWMSPAQEISGAVLMACPSALKKGIKIEVSSEGIPERIYSDPNRFRQILINLISNAINFTDQGRIVVDSKMNGELLQIRVTDTGIGIDPAQSAKIFEPFVRGDLGARKREPGTGLGLALALDLSRALGGNLWLAHSQPGRGSTFVYTVETAAPKEPAQERKPMEIAPIEESLAGKNILVAEDDDDLRTLIRWNLETAGAKVQSVNNGVDAVAKAEGGAFDAILMDIQMPVMDGHRATEKLRGHGYSKPIYALTAHASFEEKERCLEAGFTGYISKPFEPRTLVQTLCRNLGLH